jgi:hypothetical protein
MSPAGSPFDRHLQSLIELYVVTKDVVLLAEQRDQDSRSHISVFKEQRDALDHLIRAATRHYGATQAPESEEYIRGQFSKATGHLYRAAYDALDGMAISFRGQIHNAFQGASNECIQSVFPKYFDHVSEATRLLERVATHRKNKDIGDGTLANLSEYRADIEKLSELAKECQIRSGVVAEKWMGRQRKTDRRFKILVPLILGIICAILGAAAKWAFDRYGSSRSAPAPSATSSSAATGK